MLLVWPGSNVMCWLTRVAILLVAVLTIAACGSAEQAAQVDVTALTPTPLATTPPLAVPTPSPTPVPTATAMVLPALTATPLPAPTPAPTVPPAPTPQPAAPASEPTPVPTAPAAEPIATATAEPATVETPTALSTPVPTVDGAADPTTEPTAEATALPTALPTETAEAPTAVVATGEIPLECYDPVVFVYRAFVEGVDELSFEAGKVSCVGAGTNGVAADRSYRHQSGLVVQRNANFVFNDAGTGYIPYSGTMHFCLAGQASSAAFRADTVPALLIVIDNEARRLIGEGAARPSAFDGGGTRC